MQHRSVFRLAAIRLGITLFSVVATLVVFEIVLRIGNFYPRYRLTVRVPGLQEWSHVLLLHPEYLFTVKPDGSGRTEINNYGYRDRNFSPQKSKTRVLVLGDSFIMGNNVRPEETISAKLDGILGADAEAYNMGIAGYGPDQLLRRYMNEGTEIEADLVVLSVFAGNDFRDLAVNRIYSGGEAGKPAWSRTNPVTEAIPFLRTEMLIRQAFTGHYLRPGVEKELTELLLSDREDGVRLPSSGEGARRRELMKSLLGQFAHIVRAEDRKFIVLVVPGFEAVRRWSAGEAEEFEAEAALIEDTRTLGIDRCELLPAVKASGGIELYDPDDRHFTVHGTEVAARALAECITTGRLLDPGPENVKSAQLR